MSRYVLGLFILFLAAFLVAFFLLGLDFHGAPPVDCITKTCLGIPTGSR